MESNYGIQPNFDLGAVLTNSSQHSHSPNTITHIDNENESFEIEDMY